MDLWRRISGLFTCFKADLPGSVSGRGAENGVHGAKMPEDTTSSKSDEADDPAAMQIREYRRVYEELGLSFSSAADSQCNVVTKLVSDSLRVPIVLMLLYDGSRTHIISAVGLTPDASGAFKGHFPPMEPIWVASLPTSQVEVVEDMSQDARFAGHRLVLDGPRLKSWAAAPLLTPQGLCVGALGIGDSVARTFDSGSCTLLLSFAEMLMRDAEKQAQYNKQLETLSEASFDRPQKEKESGLEPDGDGIILCDVSQERWPILFANDWWQALTGQDRDSIVKEGHKPFWETFSAPGINQQKEKPWQHLEAAIKKGEGLEVNVIRGNDGKRVFPVSFRPLIHEGESSSPHVGALPQIPDSYLTAEGMARLYYGIIRRKRLRSSIDLTRRNSSTTAKRVIPFSDVQLGSLLGRGGYGSVYFGSWNGSRVAVKVIEHVSTHQELMLASEQLEAFLGSRMSHPNIVRTFKSATQEMVGNAPPRDPYAFLTSPSASAQGNIKRSMETWIVLELCNRGSLQEAIDRGAFKKVLAGGSSTPDLVRVLATALEIASALAYLHSVDILHSDLNANNVLLSSNPDDARRPFTVKVADFGLSRIQIGDGTIATKTYGTVTHMPPELLTSGKLSKAADVYAFGVLLWEVYCGRRPWAGLRNVSIIAQKSMMMGNLKFPPDTAPDLQALGDACMENEHHRRPSFKEIVEQLKEMLAAAKASEARTTSLPTELGAQQRASI